MKNAATSLYLLTRELAKATDLADLLAIVIREVRKAFRADAALSLPDDSEEAPLTPYFASTWNVSEKELSVAVWAFRHREPAGRGTDTLPSSEGIHYPLLAGERTVGVLSLRFQDSAPMEPAQREVLEAFVRQIALAIDRERLRETEQQTKLVAESERLGQTLLNSISHEMRTPIAAITSAVSSVSENPITRATPFLGSMMSEIQEAAGRLNCLVGNLLNITRLESGHIKPKLDWCDLSVLIQVTLREIEKELLVHPVKVELEKGLPLVRLDFVLMQQVLSNLLLNAAVHTPSGTPIEIKAKVEAKTLFVTVADTGPGLPVDALACVFDEFYRGPEARAGGTGLGLSIVKGFVEAQGGQIKAENQSGGGALFTIRLSLSDVPPPLQQKPLYER